MNQHIRETIQEAINRQLNETDPLESFECVVNGKKQYLTRQEYEGLQ